MWRVAPAGVMEPAAQHLRTLASLDCATKRRYFSISSCDANVHFSQRPGVQGCGYVACGTCGGEGACRSAPVEASSSSASHPDLASGEAALALLLVAIQSW